MAPEIMEILQKSLDWIEEHLRADPPGGALRHGGLFAFPLQPPV